MKVSPVFNQTEKRAILTQQKTPAAHTHPVFFFLCLIHRHGPQPTD